MSGKKKKGKSLGEKEEIVLKVYHEYKEPFNLAEIEKLASSRGVVQQSIKDVNQNLLYDNKILSDKIGSGNFFWSFPSKQLSDRITKKELLDKQISFAREALKAAEDAAAQAGAERCAEGRPAKMQRIAELLQEERTAELLLEANKKNDPVEIERVVKAAATCKVSQSFF